ncbi:cellulose biosynthesis cyclic di-GMP-binding regulatory protein BcsB [Xylophilus sp.]|uniref:cellulose biosynthesis cyclic di-GMP-binding regulatory protein BcsB n=1 Tax=Xylophilus sp. TaxID=2653893 RepID=UPI0013BA1CEE|nr:cellulose biosynthesis cyclic di-GMP-binding regulatory protein BcsB [Xylophilus sp.]KAF1050047.1 MAG: Cyclic di-GMP-binding protein [Xylophilus sp.]
MHPSFPAPASLPRTRRARLLSVALAVALLGAMAPAAQDAAAAPRARDAAAPAEPLPVAAPAEAAAGSRTYTLTLRQLGAVYPLQLRGVQGTAGVQFSIRSDEVVTAARLKLHYAYSPALIPQLSHIKVLVNDEVAAAIPVPAEQAGQNLQREIALPPRLITEFNRLNLQLIGHYTLDCEDPAHSSLWANAGNDSVLELTVAPVAQAADLALLPQPFFDRRDVRPLVLPIVFAGAPAAGTLEAAGTISSWFGALAGYRGARFPAAVGEIPAQGNAVGVALAGEALPGLALPALQGPTVAVVPHPNDAHGRLLLVLGRDAKELKTAAAALALGAPALSGPLATITGLQELKARKPYDAPNWLASDRPVKFGELVEQDALDVAGYYPDRIRVNFHLPPDLFAWRSKGIPVDLKYRYSPRPQPDKSTLNISANEQFLRSLPLLSQSHAAPGTLDRLAAKAVPAGELVPAREQFHIPLFKLPAQAQLQFHYYYEIVKEGACKDVLLDNVRGTVEPDSTIDISGFPHYLAMPDLAAFANSGFPFTRLADLSETTVVLPERPAAADLSAYLGLLGHLGRASGYPATAVRVAAPQQTDQLKGRDLLVIGSGDDQPLLKTWANALPASLSGEAKRLRLSDFAYRVFHWWDTSQRDGAQPGRNQVAFRSDSADAVIAGFESPLSSGRSVVAVVASRSEGLAQAVDALLDAERVKEIQGSTAAIRGKRVDSLVAEQTYHVGRLGPLTWLQWQLSRSPFLLTLLGVAAAVLVAILLYLSLRGRAQRRLRPGE